MKKNLLLLFAAALLIVSCGKKGSDGHYINTIPTTAKFVVAIDVNSMITKSGVTAEQKSEFITTTVASVSDQCSAESSEKLKQVFENPEAVGIAKESKIYVFSDGDTNNPMVLLNVVDKSKLEAMFATFAKDSICTAPTTESGNTWSLIDGSMLLIFNESALLICENYDQSKQNATKFLAQKDGFAGTESYKKMVANNYDIELFASMSMITDQLKSMSSSLVMPQQMYDLTGVNIVSALNFENGRAVAKMEYIADSDKAKELLNTQREMVGKIGNEFLKQIPSSLMFMTATNINGESIVKYIKKYDVDNAIPAQFLTAMSSIDGDVLISFNDLVQMNPSISMFAKVKDKTLLDLILENKSSFGSFATITNVSGNEYTFVMNGVTVYFGVKDNVMYVTTEKESATNLGKATKDSFADSQWSKIATSSTGYVMFNIENVLQNEMVKSMLAYQSAFREPVVMEALNKLSYMEYYVTEDAVLEFSLNIKDKNENILKVICALAGSIN